MMPEILDYDKERLNNWSWLSMLGRPAWHTEVFKGMSSGERQRRFFNYMRNFVGFPTLDVWRSLLVLFNSDPGIAAVHCVFYYYDREPDSTEFIKRESRVVFPFDVAIDSNLISWDWINRERSKLAKKWGLGPVSFGVSGNVYCKTEWEWMRSPLFEKGELGEYWIHDDRVRMSPKHFYRERFMVFGDIDKKTSDEQFLSASRQLGTPLLIADTKRGHHVLFPLLFGSGIGGAGVRDAEVLATREMGLVIGANFESRYLHRSHGNYEYVVRVSSGLRREETPKISAFVWDGNTIVRSPAPESA